MRFGERKFKLCSCLMAMNSLVGLCSSSLLKSFHHHRCGKNQCCLNHHINPSVAAHQETNKHSTGSLHGCMIFPQNCVKASSMPCSNWCCWMIRLSTFLFICILSLSSTSGQVSTPRPQSWKEWLTACLVRSGRWRQKLLKKQHHNGIPSPPWSFIPS